MKKILWLSHEGDLGGANKCLAEQIKILADEGYKISVIVLRKDSFADDVAKNVTSIHVVYFYGWIIELGNKFRPLLFLKRMLRNTWAVVQTLRIIYKVKPDYIATNTTTIPVAAIAAKLSFKKHIWFIHEFSEEDHGYRVFCGFKNGARLINWLSQKVVFNSEAVMHKYDRFIPDSKKFIAHNPVVLKEPGTIRIKNNNLDTNILRVIILGQIAPSKNQMEALQALAILKNQHLQVQLKIVGNLVNKGYFEKMQAYIATHELASDVEIVDYTTDPFSLVQQADVLLMCSRMEAFGRVTVEALKLGVPVIAANSGGSPEIIQHGSNGYLYQAGNPADLALALQRFIENRTGFNNGKIALKAKERFNEENTKKQLLQIFC